MAKPDRHVCASASRGYSGEIHRPSRIGKSAESSISEFTFKRELSAYCQRDKQRFKLIYLSFLSATWEGT